MKHPKQGLKKAVEQTGQFINEKSGDAFSQISGKGLKNYSSIKDVIGISDESAEGVYAQAYLLYNTGRYKDAAELFRLLIMLNSTESKYLMGLAACYHMQKEYYSASSTYALVSVMDPNNPVPFFHASDCYIQMGDKASAALMLEMAVKRAENKPEFTTLKQRAEITLLALKKEILEGGLKPGEK